MKLLSVDRALVAKLLVKWCVPLKFSRDIQAIPLPLVLSFIGPFSALVAVAILKTLLITRNI